MDLLSTSLAALRAEGFVLHERLVAVEVVASLRNTLDGLTLPTAFNYAAGHLHLRAPRTPDVLVEPIFGVPLLSTLAAALLGPAPSIVALASNLSLPCAVGQPLHSDIPHRRSVGPNSCSQGLVFNVFLSDVTEMDGPTEVVAGSHTWNISSIAPDSRLIPPDYPVPSDLRITLVAPAGSVVVRDIRLWHRATPNTGPSSRHLLSWIVRPSSATSGSLTISSEMQRQLAEWGWRVVARPPSADARIEQ